jgi:hypothetical protein
MTPEEKRGLLELLRWMVDDLERCYQAGSECNAHAERIGNMRVRLGELGPYVAKRPYLAPRVRELDAAEVVEKFLSTLSEGEIQMVLGRVAVRRQAKEHEEARAAVEGLDMRAVGGSRVSLLPCTCSSERDLSKDGHERGCPEYGRSVAKRTKGGDR